MNYFKNKAIIKVIEYQIEAEQLHLFRSKQKRLYSKLFTESWLAVAIDFRISRLLFRKSILKRLFNV